MEISMHRDSQIKPSLIGPGHKVDVIYKVIVINITPIQGFK